MIYCDLYWEEDISMLFGRAKKGCGFFTAEILDNDYSSKWNVYEETHDDYPLEADEVVTWNYIYFLKVDEKGYLAKVAKYKIQGWTPPDNYSDEICAYATLTVHQLPKEMCDVGFLKENLKKAQEYCENEGKWSPTLTSKRISCNVKEYSKMAKENTLLVTLVSEQFGKQLKLKNFK